MCFVFLQLCLITVNIKWLFNQKIYLYTFLYYIYLLLFLISCVSMFVVYIILVYLLLYLLVYIIYVCGFRLLYLIEMTDESAWMSQMHCKNKLYYSKYYYFNFTIKPIFLKQKKIFLRFLKFIVVKAISWLSNYN